MRNSGHWTLVTGGAKRLGAEICSALAAEGHHILVHYKSSKIEADRVAEACRKHGVQAESIQGSFNSQESTLQFLDEVVEKYPNTANLINNVGNYIIKSALGTTVPEWYHLFQTNLHAPFILSRGLAPSIKAAKGSIINVGVVGIDHIPADTHYTAFTSTKLALWMLTKSLAKELAPNNVRVNMVSPGYLDNAVDLPEDPSLLPMKRPAKPWEVARVVAFLLEEDSAYITGQNIEVAGGVRLN